MAKKVFVINGKGGVGKDTLCTFASHKYKVMNHSSIDPIKAVARMLGWTGGKTMEDRKFLSDLKQLAIAYNDYPTTYLVDKVNEFMASDSDILFVHIRETDQIAHFIEAVNGNAYSLLIRREAVNNATYGNRSDDEVENYDYDYIYNNDMPAEEAETDFLGFLENIMG